MNNKEIQTLELDRESIGLKISDLRNQRGMSQTQLGLETGYSRGQIWQFERGVGLTLENIAKMSWFFNKPIEYFLEVK